MAASTWKTVPLTEGEKNTYLPIGPLRMWLKQRNEEIWVTNDYLGETGSDELPGDIIWSRFAKDGAGNEVQIKPVFPDRPVIISSEFPLRIAAGSRIRIFTRVPVSVHLSMGKKQEMLTEIPTIKLSKTWFGSPIEGELCYWQSTKARRSLEGLDAEPHLIRCPISIINKSEIDLNFEKFSFPVNQLSVFQKNEELWADETLIEYHGDEHESTISVTGKVSPDVGKATLLSAPRHPISHHFTSRAFKRLFDDTFISAR